MNHSLELEEINPLTLPKQAMVFTYLQYKSFENTMGKGEIARNEQFLLFSLYGVFSAIFIKFEAVVCNSFILKEFKICCLGKG